MRNFIKNVPNLLLYSACFEILQQEVEEGHNKHGEHPYKTKKNNLLDCKKKNMKLGL